MSENLTVEYKSIEQLRPYIGNPRTHSRQQIRQIAKSIQSFGFINPVVIDEKDQLVAGHGRLLAAMELGILRIPCISIDHLSEAEKRTYLLADNKLADNAGWDIDLLRIELDFLVDTTIDIELTGFSTPEIDLILGNDSEVSPEVPPPLPPNRDEIVSRAGDMWILGAHRLLCGDCRELDPIVRLMAGQQARLIFTDPPYNVPIDGHARGLGKDHHRDFLVASGELSSQAFTEFLQQSLGRLATVSQDGSLHYICMDWRHLQELLTAGATVYSDFINLCVWNKSNGGMGSFYRSKHELILVYKKGKAPHINNVELGRHGRYRTNVWDYPGVSAFGSDRDEALSIHPTVKPVRLIADAILDASKRGDIVLDGFAGSGSTLLAAEQTGRLFRGIEIDPAYVDVIIRRWCDVTGEPAIHDLTGHSFDEMYTLLAPVDKRMGVAG